jgi:hypothetical protein
VGNRGQTLLASGPGADVRDEEDAGSGIVTEPAHMGADPSWGSEGNTLSLIAMGFDETIGDQLLEATDPDLAA